MATKITISNGDYINIDDYGISWTDKGSAWQDDWCPTTIHYVIWDESATISEIQNKDSSTGMMTGNTTLSSTSDSVGSTTIANLLTWGDTRKAQIKSAETDLSAIRENAETAWVDAGNSKDDFLQENSLTHSFFDWSKSWIDYDEDYS
tara:strand:+ start:497 stop:940 length:444 start_codon:yes stop_codon:yes gene_type:complete